MIFSFELNDEDTKFVKAYADENGETIGEVAKRAVVEYVEDIMDARAADIAWAEYAANPVTYSIDEVDKRLGLA